jgi:hypothetical protein
MRMCDPRSPTASDNAIQDSKSRPRWTLEMSDLPVLCESETRTVLHMIAELQKPATRELRLYLHKILLADF